MRTVTFESHVSKELYEIYGGAALADDAMAVIEWTLSRDPRVGQEMGHGYWAIEHEGAGIWKRLIFYYDFTDDDVCIQGIKTFEE
jgi:hypothetical protein